MSKLTRDKRTLGKGSKKGAVQCMAQLEMYEQLHENAIDVNHDSP